MLQLENNMIKELNLHAKFDIVQEMLPNIYHGIGNYQWFYKVFLKICMLLFTCIIPKISNHFLQFLEEYEAREVVIFETWKIVRMYGGKLQPKLLPKFFPDSILYEEAIR